MKIEFEYLKNSIEKLELDRLQDRALILEEKVVELRKSKEESEKRFLQIVVLEEKVAVLQKAKEEGEKRHWQYVYLIAGSMLTLLCTIVVQLVLVALKK